MWEVELSSRFSPYKPPQQQLLEAAYQRGEASVRVELNGQSYEVSLRGGDKRQRSCADASRSRKVRRREEMPTGP